MEIVPSQVSKQYEQKKKTEALSSTRPDQVILAPLRLLDQAEIRSESGSHPPEVALFRPDQVILAGLRLLDQAE